MSKIVTTVLAIGAAVSAGIGARKLYLHLKGKKQNEEVELAHQRWDWEGPPRDQS